MSDDTSGNKAPGGPRRLINAFRYTCAGFRHAIRNEVAIREELIVLAILAPASALFPVTRVEHLILVLALLLVVLVEFINSAIEATIDRISRERHPLAGQAKDLGSAAVFIALVMCTLSWLVIAGPVLASWISGPPGPVK
jgi:diacylglycerol kinase (ATP)